MNRADDDYGPLKPGFLAEKGQKESITENNHDAFAGQISSWRMVLARLSTPASYANGALQNAVLQELQYRDVFAWVPVLLAFGVLAYYALPVEPSLLALCVVWLICGSAVVLLRHKFKSLLAAIGLLALVTGISLATWQTYRIDTVLLPAAGTYQLVGTVTRIEAGAKRTRLELHATDLLDGSAEQALDAIQLSGYNQYINDIRIGDRVMVRARLEPFSGPIIPGGYDFRRAGYFRGFSARGYILGAVYPEFDLMQGAKILSFSSRLALFRKQISARIWDIVPGQSGALASALLVGDRSRINEETETALRGAGLAHILAISGLHMALVTTLIFGFIRLIFAFSPSMVSRYNAKKVAAIFALVSALTYLGLSGAAVSAQRAFIMAAIFLIAILCDRPAITQRNLAIAACVIIFMNPNAVLGPGFQMSFMASVGLVSVFSKHGMVNAFKRAVRQRYGVRQGIIGKGVAGVSSIALTSLVAGIATAPFAVYHFYQTAAFGLVGNLIAMPIVALVIMPAGVVAMLLLPFGLAVLPLLVMEYGLSLVVSCANWVSSLDGAMLRVGLQSGAVVSLFAVTILTLCLLRTHLKYTLAALMAAAALILANTNNEQPVILIAPNAQMVATVEAGQLRILARGKNKFVSHIWLGSLADRRDLSDILKASKTASTCTKAACVSVLERPDVPALTIVQIKRVEFFEDGCRIAGNTILISKLDLPTLCPNTASNPLIIDRTVQQTTGSIAFYSPQGNSGIFERRIAKQAAEFGFRIQTARDKNKRPWH